MKYTLTIIIVLFFIISGCKKELGVFLLNEMKNENPYTGDETLKYLSNNGDTIVLQGNGRYSEEFYSDNYYNDDKYYVNEKDKCSFIDKESNYELFIELTSRTVSFHQASQPDARTSYLMDIKFKDQSGNNTTDCRSISSSVGLPIIYNHGKDFFYDSLLVNEKYYYDVVRISYFLYDGLCTERLKADTAYFCKSNGIIKLSFNNNITWELLAN
jgi:hypothetical protein